MKCRPVSVTTTTTTAITTRVNPAPIITTTKATMSRVNPALTRTTTTTKGAEIASNGFWQ